MREKISEALKSAADEGNLRRLSTMRLILAAIRERDIAARAADRCDGASDEEILDILRTMVRQRHESARSFEESGRLDLAEQERAEIEIIGAFLPRQLSEDEIQGACQEVVEEMGATALRDMGRCMGTLKKRYAGRMDFAKASSFVKARLAVRPASVQR